MHLFDFVVYRELLTTKQTTRVSLDANGNERNQNSYGSVAISANGRYVSYLGEDSNHVNQVFVYDRQTQKTTLVSVNTTGATEGNDHCNQQSITAAGKFITFSSSASDLVADDTNGRNDIFVRGPQYDFPWTMVLPAITGGQK
jgi:Tol biopolymer transport system component